MQTHISTTPFGRRALTLGQIASQATAKAMPKEAAANKWLVFQHIREARELLGATDRSLAILNALALYHALGHPLLLGASRKRFIGALSNEAPAHKRTGGSLAAALQGMNAGVQLLRVHDVAETVQARDIWRGMRDGALTDFSDIID